MSSPLVRVIGLLELLEAGGTRTVGDLAARLGVDERTVRRYADHLVDVGVPVESVRGRYGGYRLAPGHRMPPLMLNDEEALAVMLALVGTADRDPAGQWGAARQTATAKIRRVLPHALTKRLDAVLATTERLGPPPAESREAEQVMLFARAALHRRPVAFCYLDRGGRESQRMVHPYGIVARARRWYLTGADAATGEVRAFRLDRIAEPTEQPGSFEVPKDFDAAGVVRRGVFAPRGGRRVSVRVRAGADEVRRRLPADLVEVEQVDDHWSRLVLYAERLDWVPSLLVGLGRPFVIEEPPELNHEVRALARRLTAYAAE